jgi:hypothetical protein
MFNYLNTMFIRMNISFSPKYDEIAQANEFELLEPTFQILLYSKTYQKIRQLQ